MIKKIITLLAIFAISTVGFAEKVGDPTKSPKEFQEYQRLLSVGVGTTEPPEPKVEVPPYKMYISRDGDTRALLDKKFVKIGDKYNNLTVVSISKNAVVLEESNGSQYIAKLYSGTGVTVATNTTSEDVKEMTQGKSSKSVSKEKFQGRRKR